MRRSSGGFIALSRVAPAHIAEAMGVFTVEHDLDEQLLPDQEKLFDPDTLSAN